MAWTVELAQMLTPAQDMAALEPSVGISWDRMHAERQNQAEGLTVESGQPSSMKDTSGLFPFILTNPNSFLEPVLLVTATRGHKSNRK